MSASKTREQVEAACSLIAFAAVIARALGFQRGSLELVLARSFPGRSPEVTLEEFGREELLAGLERDGFCRSDDPAAPDPEALVEKVCQWLSTEGTGWWNRSAPGWGSDPRWGRHQKFPEPKPKREQVESIKDSIAGSACKVGYAGLSKTLNDRYQPLLVPPEPAPEPPPEPVPPAPEVEGGAGDTATVSGLGPDTVVGAGTPELGPALPAPDSETALAENAAATGPVTGGGVGDDADAGNADNVNAENANGATGSIDPGPDPDLVPAEEALLPPEEGTEAEAEEQPPLVEADDALLDEEEEPPLAEEADEEEEPPLAEEADEDEEEEPPTPVPAPPAVPERSTSALLPLPVPPARPAPEGSWVPAAGATIFALLLALAIGVAALNIEIEDPEVRRQQEAKEAETQARIEREKRIDAQAKALLETAEKEAKAKAALEPKKEPEKKELTVEQRKLLDELNRPRTVVNRPDLKARRTEAIKLWREKMLPGLKKLPREPELISSLSPRRSIAAAGDHLSADWQKPGSELDGAEKDFDAFLYFALKLGELINTEWVPSPALIDLWIIHRRIVQTDGGYPFGLEEKAILQGEVLEERFVVVTRLRPSPDQLERGKTAWLNHLATLRADR